jgi:hypothetical protein|nr:MAG TPA: Protein of unknown function (DUF1360) [Caudoviricetes sp.]
MPTLTQIIMISLLTTFSILLIGKIGLRDMVIEHSPILLISKLFDCDFCLSFWASMLFSIVCVCLANDLAFMVVPFFSTPIVRFLL